MSTLFNSILGNAFSVGTYLLCLLTAVICGIMTALAASFKNRCSKSFLIALIVLPAIVTVGTGIAVAGAFSLVRFRSAAGKAKDIAMIFLVMTAGLACAAGYIMIAFLFTLLTCLVLAILSVIPFGAERMIELHITIPESLHYMDAFDDLFLRFTKRQQLVKAKTTNMGSLYKLVYRIELQDATKSQEFIDELRCRNGNLEIALMELTEGVDEL